MIDILLIYPRLGSMDSMVVDLPLSIIYAAAESVKRGYSVEGVDLRIEKNWRATLRRHLDKGVRLAGLSVMTGMPLQNARAVSRLIRQEYPDTRIVWGGPHVTVIPETIHEDFVDFLIRGYGSKSLADLTQRLKEGASDFSEILGLSYLENGAPVHAPRSSAHEIIPFRELPYHLVDVRSPSYLRSYSGKMLFPIFTAIGCPYRCSFCIHPKVYEAINGAKWRPLDDDEVLGHIEYVMRQFGTDHIVFIDDTSFPDIERMRRIFQEIIRRGYKLTLEFRGARINEIDRMDEDFLELMIKAGGRAMMVGVESGSNKVLKEFQKGITREQILRVNRKLAKFPLLTPYYNFIYGTPGETYEDLVETKNVLLQLLRDNKNAYFGFGGDWKPIPGTKTIEIAETQYNYRVPKTLDEWIEIDSSDAKQKLVHPWYTPAHNNLIKLMQVSSFVVDDKIIKESKGNNSLLFRLLRLMSRTYKPFAMFRLRFSIHQFMIEYEVWRFMVNIMQKFPGRGSANA